MGILELGQYAAALSAIAVLFGMAIKWGIVKPIKAYLTRQPIKSTQRQMVVVRSQM